MSQALRKLAGIISKTLTAVIFINQISMKIGVVDVIQALAGRSKIRL
jgi:RecA/RadA recombinase